MGTLQQERRVSALAETALAEIAASLAASSPEPATEGTAPAACSSPLTTMRHWVQVQQGKPQVHDRSADTRAACVHRAGATGGRFSHRRCETRSPGGGGDGDGGGGGGDGDWSSAAGGGDANMPES